MKIFKGKCSTGKYKARSKHAKMKYGFNSCRGCMCLEYQTAEGEVAPDHSVADVVICKGTHDVLFRETELAKIVQNQKERTARERNKEARLRGQREAEEQRNASVEVQENKKPNIPRKRNVVKFSGELAGLPCISDSMQHTVTLEQFKRDCMSLTKENLGTLLGLDNYDKHKKDDLVEATVRLIWGNDLLMLKVYKEFELELSMHPSEVEKTIGCTNSERQAWSETGKLNVVASGSFRKWGKVINYSLFDRYQIYHITQDMVKSWREEKRNRTAANRKKAVEKAIKTKVINESCRENFKREFKRILSSWFKIDPRLGAAFQLAFWTVWVSRWAKENQVKARKAIRKTEEYDERADALYALKNKALKLLVRSPFVKVSFYRPEQPHRENIIFCADHYRAWREMRPDFDYVDKWEYFHLNRSSIANCPLCNYEVDKDYYSLFYLEVQDERVPDHKFSFHTPYLIGKGIFPSIANLPKVSHVEQLDSIFRFGRAVFEEEKVVCREKDVVRYSTDSLQKYLLYFPDDGELLPNK